MIKYFLSIRLLALAYMEKQEAKTESGHSKGEVSSKMVTPRLLYVKIKYSQINGLFPISRHAYRSVHDLCDYQMKQRLCHNHLFP